MTVRTPDGKPVSVRRTQAGRVVELQPVVPPPITVAVQCHGAYLPYLPACLAAIDAQTCQPTARLLVLDRCDPPAWLPPNWTVIRRADGSPNPGRNAALDACQTEWIWFMDADDCAHPRYLAGAARCMGSRDVGIVHADLRYSDGRLHATPHGTDYWGLRLANYVSTESVWRTAALREAGGWRPTERWDDWTCALAVTRNGWHTARNDVPILVTVHPGEHRNANTTDLPHKWLRSYGIVCLLAGRRDVWPDWRSAVLGQAVPPSTHWYLVDNSCSPEFGAGVLSLACELIARGEAVSIVQDSRTFERVDHYSSHRHVASLYNRVLPMVSEDACAFWEDDNLPREPDAFRRLVDHWDHNRVGGICALYETRNVPGHACAALAHDYWHNVPTLASCRGHITHGVGYLPGGFAIYNNALVRASLPYCVDFPGGKARGWDGRLSEAVRAARYRLDLDGLVECEHRFGRV